LIEFTHMVRQGNKSSSWVHCASVHSLTSPMPHS